MGGSLAKACRRSYQLEFIAGVDRDSQTLEKAHRVVDLATTSLSQGVAEADLVVVAVPVCSIAPVIKEMAPYLSPQAVVSDLGSVKSALMEDAHRILKGRNPFVGVHPIAGSERSGFEASFAELFDGKLCVLTPRKDTDANALKRVEEFWQDLGASTVLMDEQEHDRMFAAVSHLPHLAAYALINAISQLADGGEGLFAYRGGGLNDFTRIVASSPVMWRDICLLNRGFILEMIEKYQSCLEELKQAVKLGDGEGLIERFEKARRCKLRLMGG
jgi:prephenate dehydrogenase